MKGLHWETISPEMRQVEDMGRQKLHRESQAFLAMHSELMEKYAGQAVAIHQGQVIDHDLDVRGLYLRMRSRYGDTPVLIRQVTERGENTLTFRSPRLGAL